MMNEAGTTFRAAAVQDSAVWLDREASTDKVIRLIEEAAAGGADIVAFPESIIPGFPYWVFTHALPQSGDWHRRFYENAIEVAGPVTERIGKACAEASIFAVVGVTERMSGFVGTLYNTNLVFGSDGTLLGMHRKLVPTWGERVVWSGGDGTTMGVFPTPWGPLGTLICGENINTLARFALLAQGERIHVLNCPSPAMAGARHALNEMYLGTAPHAYEGKLYSILACEYGSPEIAEELGIDLSAIEGSCNCLSGIMGPDGEWVTPPLIDQRGIVYADCPIEPVIHGKLFHDITGHYNRFDVLKLELDRTPRPPIRFG